MKEKIDFRYFVYIIAFSFSFISLLAYFYLEALGFTQLINSLFGVSLGTIFFSLLLVHYGLKKMPFHIVYWITILFYITMIAWLIHLTGGPGSRMQSLFIFIIVAGSYFQGIRGGIVTTILSLMFLGIIFLLEYLGVLGGMTTPISRAEMLQSLYYNSIVFLLFAFLSYFVAEKLQKTGEELEKARLSSSKILESIPSGVITIERRKKVTYRNKSAMELLTSAEEQFLIKKVLENPGVPLRDEINIGGKIIGYSSRILPDGSVILVFQDLTEIKKIEQEKLNLERLALLGEFAANLAHEIRNPVTAINTAMELLYHKQINPDREFLESIMKEAERLNRIATDFLRFSKIPSPRFMEINLKNLIDETVEEVKSLYKNNKKIEIQQKACSELLIYADPEQLRSALLNILKNAIEAIKSEGKIFIVCIGEGKSVNLYDSEEIIPTGYVGVLIEDTGEGMDEDTLKRARDIFFTTKKEGTGFGLSIVERIVKNHGGFLKISSRKDKGTQVLIVLRRNHAR